MGTSLYNDKTVALRELLQNSIDACRCRKAREAGYEGKISYKLVKEHTDEGEVRKIIVEDNGVGMDDYVIEKYFMRIGKSYYQSRDFKKEGILFSPISVFGIGILSCFMMADKIDVETLKEGSEPRKVEIENHSEYFVTRAGGRTEPGTTISLFLKDDVELDLIEELKNYARHVEFPIYVDDGENTETIVDPGYDFNFVDYMNPLYKQYTDELNPYVIDFEKEGIEGVKGKIAFMFLKDENSGYGFKSRNLSFAEHEDVMAFGHYLSEIENRFFLSQDGMSIRIIGSRYFITKLFPVWVAPDYNIFFDVNLEDAAKIDLTIDRNAAVTNEKYHILKIQIENIILNHIEKIFSQKHLVTDKDKNRFMKCFFKMFCRNIDHMSNITLERLKRSIIFECSVKGVIEYLKYGELKDMRGYFYLIVNGALRNNTFENVKNAIEHAYPEAPIIYSAFGEELLELLLNFGETVAKKLPKVPSNIIVVTNKVYEFNFLKVLLLPSLERRDKRGYGCIFEGDYKNCFGTFLITGRYATAISPNINHPFMRLVNKNMDTFKGK
jgi:hypothetical protein